jgi:hypothetical protein
MRPEEFEERATLDADTASGLEDAQATAVGELLDEQHAANLVGVGLGVKWTGGEPTGEPAVVLMVSHKVEEQLLRPEDRLPDRIADAPTDVLAIGRPVAGGDVPPASAEALTVRRRPVPSGASVGHRDITAGTIGTCVYEQLPGATRNPPAPGIGLPRDYFILSKQPRAGEHERRADRGRDPAARPRGRGPAPPGPHRRAEPVRPARPPPARPARPARQPGRRGACPGGLRRHPAGDPLGGQAAGVAAAVGRPRRRARPEDRADDELHRRARHRDLGHDRHRLPRGGHRALPRTRCSSRACRPAATPGR